jgi:hypothetical protein
MRTVIVVEYDLPTDGAYNPLGDAVRALMERLPDNAVSLHAAIREDAAAVLGIFTDSPATTVTADTQQETETK